MNSNEDHTFLLTSRRNQPLSSKYIKPALGHRRLPRRKPNYNRKSEGNRPSPTIFFPRCTIKDIVNWKQYPSSPRLSIDNNVVVKCLYKTSTGHQCGKPKPNNQDSFTIKPCIQNVKSQHFFGVFDGHGRHGHKVSNLIKVTLEKNIEELIPPNSHESVFPNVMKIGISRTVEFIEESSIDTNFSGSTLTTVLIKNEQLVCANIGDSRAVIGKRMHAAWESFELSRDHKPELLSERIRILKTNGRIAPYYDRNNEPIGPQRVWLEHSHVPGLAMSRSIGDRVAHTIGVISTPEIKTFPLAATDKFLILATDGIWEVLTSQEAVEIVGRALDSDQSDNSSVFLTKEAVKRWGRYGHVIDDITVLVVILNVSNKSL